MHELRSFITSLIGSTFCMEFVDNRIQLCIPSKKQGSHPCCQFDNERVLLVCCRDNVNKYANAASFIQINLCSTLKFVSKPTSVYYESTYRSVSFTFKYYVYNICLKS